jgi:membrane-bound lytic murein transglycosylase D
MIRTDRKTLFTALILLATSFVILTIAFGFRGLSGISSQNGVADTVIINKPFKIPAEVTFAGENLPLENFDTRESLERELLTSAYRHSSTILIIKRAHRYLPVIEKILKENNMPDDFKYLVAAESEYSNMISPVGATGFWQIMPETGKEQGMEINNEVDERYSIEKSTEFACDYFKKSFDKFGNWTLAAASYDGGRAALDEQIAIQHQNNYYNLLLTEETARYIFRAVAYKLIITDPERFGFRIKEDELYPELKYYEVNVDSTVTSFSSFAEHFGTNYKLIKLLNPWLRKPYLNAKPNKIYTIKIPEEGMRNNDKAELSL